MFFMQRLLLHMLPSFMVRTSPLNCCSLQSWAGTVILKLILKVKSGDLFKVSIGDCVVLIKSGYAIFRHVNMCVNVCVSIRGGEKKVHQQPQKESFFCGCWCNFFSLSPCLHSMLSKDQNDSVEDCLKPHSESDVTLCCLFG